MFSRLAKRRSAASPSAVYERRKRMILDRQIAPGDPPSEEEPARTFRVSRTPVHEAQVRLERDRLSGNIS